jgi:hypothetical protein
VLARLRSSSEKTKGRWVGGLGAGAGVIAGVALEPFGLAWQLFGAVLVAIPVGWLVGLAAGRRRRWW